LPYIGFWTERYPGYARSMNPNRKIFSNINLEFVSINTAVYEINQLKNKGLMDGVSIICQALPS